MKEETHLESTTKCRAFFAVMLCAFLTGLGFFASTLKEYSLSPSSSKQSEYALATLAKNSPETLTQNSSSAVLPFLLLLGSVIAIGLSSTAIVRHRSKRAQNQLKTTTSQQLPQPQNNHADPSQMNPPAPENPYQNLTSEQLESQAGQMLLSADNAIQISKQELTFAQAQYGDQAVKPFQQAIEKAENNLSEAFHQQQKLDELPPEDQTSRREELMGIIKHSKNINSLLKQYEEDFNNLRALENNPEDALGTVEKQIEKQSTRVKNEDTRLAQLSQAYSKLALLPIEDNQSTATARLNMANSAFQQAQEYLKNNQRSEAVTAIRAAESYIESTSQLLDDIETRESDLKQAQRNLEISLSRAARDIAEAEAINKDANNPQIYGAVAGLQETLATIKNEKNAGPNDPMNLTERLETARTDLDTILNQIRHNNAAKQERAQESITNIISSAKGHIHTAQSYINSADNKISTQARTRLSEAQRSLDYVEQIRYEDPDLALQYAQQANSYASEANSLVSNTQRQRGIGIDQSGMAGLGGAVLGGMVLDSVLRGGFGGFSGQGFDGGDFGDFLDF